VAFTVWYGNGHFDPAKQEKKLSKLLKLTADQQSQVLDALKRQPSRSADSRIGRLRRLLWRRAHGSVEWN
jgi:streptomycin 6-kinase